MASRKLSPRPAPDSAEPLDPALGAPAFEDSIRRLGEIVESLEGGDLPLEESLRLFEEGVRLARTSQSRLDRAERRVEELLSVDDEGNAVVRSLEDE